MKRLFINTCVFLLRKTIVFLINILDYFKVKRGQYSWRHIINEKHVTITKINKDAYVIEWDGESIGYCLNKDFSLCDTCLFDAEIEAHIINYWFMTAIPSIALKEYKESLKNSG